MMAFIEAAYESTPQLGISCALTLVGGVAVNYYALGVSIVCSTTSAID